jgi:hypothetical protein
MKKLLIASLMAMMLMSCTNVDDDINSSQISPQSKTQNIASKSGFNPYEKDGNIYVVANTEEVFFMGEKLIASETDDARAAIEVVKNSQTSRKANVNCTQAGPFVSVSLVTVSGDGLPPSYWCVIVSPKGTSYAYQVSPISTWDCAMLYIGLYDE